MFDLHVARDLASPILISQPPRPSKSIGQSRSTSSTSTGLRKTLGSKATGSASITKLPATTSCGTTSVVETSANVPLADDFAMRTSLYLELARVSIELSRIVMHQCVKVWQPPSFSMNIISLHKQSNQKISCTIL